MEESVVFIYDSALMTAFAFPNSCSRTATPATNLAVSLDTIWDVDADSSYQVSREKASSEHLVAIRTRRGEGRLRLEGGTAFALTPQSLWIVPAAHIRAYGCSGTRWAFWWFEFLPHGPLPFPLCTALVSPPCRGERALFRQCWEALRRTSPQQAFASAVFGMLLHGWVVNSLEAWPLHPHRKRIEGIMDDMHRRLAARWSVAAMARQAGLGERRFRQVFAELSGQTPKAFYDRIRLRAADALLRQGLCNVSETADRLGFSSAFHFSRAYRRQFGHPPSASRQPTPAARQKAPPGRP